MEELGIPYEIEGIRFEEVKSARFLAVNPNGRVPAIEDPNTDVTLWESGAIIEYLVEQYDTEMKLTHAGLRERALQKQWLFFQVSGQGPYFGQAAWCVLCLPRSAASGSWL
jgi:glutathione S-transferase